MDATSDKFSQFKAELVGLCKKHRVQICASWYSVIEVHDLPDGENTIFSDAILDETSHHD